MRGRSHETDVTVNSILYCLFDILSLKGADGRCNRSIPSGTAIATFGSNGLYYAGHAAVFAGCSDDYTIRVSMSS